MSGHEATVIHQMILKPAAGVALDADQRLTADYLQRLQADSPAVALSYIRPMSLDAHVLGINPPLGREAAKALTDTLSARSDVEYAEPDFPRHR